VKPAFGQARQQALNAFIEYRRIGVLDDRDARDLARATRAPAQVCKQQNSRGERDQYRAEEETFDDANESWQGLSAPERRRLSCPASRPVNQTGDVSAR
jgi:hypothetical protein